MHLMRQTEGTIDSARSLALWLPSTVSDLVHGAERHVRTTRNENINYP